MPAKRKIIKIKSHYEKLFKSSCKNFKNDECEKICFHINLKGMWIFKS